MRKKDPTGADSTVGEGERVQREVELLTTLARTLLTGQLYAIQFTTHTAQSRSTKMPNKKMDPKALAAAKARMVERDKEYADKDKRAARAAALNAQADKEGRDSGPKRAAAKAAPKEAPASSSKPAETPSRSAPSRPVTRDQPKRKPAGPTKVTYDDLMPRRGR